MRKKISNNQVAVVGKLTDVFRFDHKAYGKNFYRGELEVKRLSDTIDYVPLMVPEYYAAGEYKGKTICVTGELHTYNDYSTGKLHVVVYVAVKRLEILEEQEEIGWNNWVYLNGYLWAKPVFRTTPSKRDIAELKIAVGRSSGKGDYIHCICWNKDAEFAATLGVGAHIELLGRIQSREYVKMLSETESEIRTVYEVSANELKEVRR